MASIRRRPSGKFQVTVRMRDGSRVSLGGFTTAALARDWAHRAETAIHRNRPHLVYALLPAARQMEIALQQILEHEQCASYLRDRLARNGCLANVGTDERTVLLGSPYRPRPFVCTHGVVLWAAPTHEQAALWQARKEANRG